MDFNKGIRLTGGLLLAGLATGIGSIAPAIDSAAYLTEAARHPVQTTVAACCQFIMSVTCLGVGVLLFSRLSIFDNTLAIAFLGSRIIAATLSIGGAILLLSILTLSGEYSQHPGQHAALAALGHVLRTSRDHVNHGFMVVVLCSGNCMLYLLLFRLNLIPRWLSLWGMSGNILSVFASMLFMFQQVAVNDDGYLALNAPTALQEATLGVWLIRKGFNQRAIARFTRSTAIG
jgi:hypothetical protein